MIPISQEWTWARLQLVMLEREGNDLCVDVLHLAGTAVAEGLLPVGQPGTLRFVGPDDRDDLLDLESRLATWTESRDGVMDCWAWLDKECRKVMLVHGIEHLVFATSTI